MNYKNIMWLSSQFLKNFKSVNLKFKLEVYSWVVRVKYRKYELKYTKTRYCSKKNWKKYKFEFRKPETFFSLSLLFLPLLEILSPSPNPIPIGQDPVIPADSEPSRSQPSPPPDKSARARIENAHQRFCLHARAARPIPASHQPSQPTPISPAPRRARGSPCVHPGAQPRPPGTPAS